MAGDLVPARKIVEVEKRTEDMGWQDDSRTDIYGVKPPQEGLNYLLLLLGELSAVRTLQSVPCVVEEAFGALWTHELARLPQSCSVSILRHCGEARQAPS